jgi:hypothetical protein
VNALEPPTPGSPQFLGPGYRLRFLNTSPGPTQRTVFPQSLQGLSSRSFPREKRAALSAQVSSSQATPAPAAPPLTRSGSRTAVGWSRSSRLPPSCVSPSHLAGLKHAGKLGDREGRGGIPAVCASARARTHMSTHGCGAVPVELRADFEVKGFGVGF